MSRAGRDPRGQEGASPPRPPRWAERLLRLRLPRGTVGDSIVGDAHEEMVRYARAGGRWPRLWYARHALGLVLRGVGSGGASHAGRRIEHEVRRARREGRRTLPELTDGLGQDARLAVRSMLRSPGFLAAAVGSLVVGVGALAAVFTLVDTLFLRPVPGVRGQERIVEIGQTSRGRAWNGWAYPDLVDVAEQADLLEAVAGFELGTVSLSEGGAGERLVAWHLTSGFFAVMGVRPLLGRDFTPAEDVGPGEHPVAVLSHRLWRERFGGDPDVIGRSLRLNRERYTVVGVAPEDFRGHVFGVAPDLYLPITQYRPARENEAFFGSRRTSWMQVVGRMRPGVEVEELNASLATIFTRLAEAYPESNADRRARAARLGRFPAQARLPLAAALGSVGALLLLVLATTCANVAGMILAKVAAQERDLAVRLALGSSRARLARHLVSESLLVFALGGLGGIAVAAAAVRHLDPNRYLPVPYPIALDLALDGRLVLFGALLTLAMGLLFGLVPAARVARADLAATLRAPAGGAGLASGRLRRVFVSGQIGISLLLLSAGALFTRSLQEAGELEVGFDRNAVHTTQLDLTLEGYRTPAEATAFVEDVVERLRALPGVETAAATTDIPLDGGSTISGALPEGRDPEAGWIRVTNASVTPSFFETMGIPHLAGRLFGPEDGRATPRVVVVGEAFARAAWPGEDPLGRRVRYGLADDLATVVGVVGDIRSDMIAADRPVHVYGLLAQDYSPAVHIAVRATETDPRPGFAAELRRAILSVDPALALPPVRPLSSYAGLGTFPHRIAASVASTLGALALLLAAIGVYGVVAFAVAQRTREIGVRIALGARRGAVVGLVVRDGLGLALPGAVFGGVAAAGIGFALRAFLLGVSPVDPLAFGGAAALLLGIVILASATPARRAASVQPVEALRQD